MGFVFFRPPPPPGCRARALRVRAAVDLQLRAGRQFQQRLQHPGAGQGRDAGEPERLRRLRRHGLQRRRRLVRQRHLDSDSTDRPRHGRGQYVRPVLVRGTSAASKHLLCCGKHEPVLQWPLQCLFCLIVRHADRPRPLSGTYDSYPLPLLFPSDGY